MARLIQAVVSATNDADLRQESPQDQASMQDDEMYARNQNARATAPATATGRAPTQQGPTDDELIAAGVADADAAAAVFAGLVTRNDNFEDPVDEPMVAPAGTNAAGTQPRAEIGKSVENISILSQWKKLEKSNLTTNALSIF